MDGLVQQPRQTSLDAGPANDRHHLADHLPDHPRQLRRRARAMDSGKGSGNRRPPVRDQLGHEFALYSDPVRYAESATRRTRYPARLGNNHLVRDRHLAIHEMGSHRASSLLRLGLNRNLASALDHDPQLGQVTQAALLLHHTVCTRLAASRFRYAFNQSAFPITETSDRAIAAAAYIGP